MQAIVCPQCGKAYPARVEYVNKTLECKNCRHKFRVEAFADESATAPKKHESREPSVIVQTNCAASQKPAVSSTRIIVAAWILCLTPGATISSCSLTDYVVSRPGEVTDAFGFTQPPKSNADKSGSGDTGYRSRSERRHALANRISGWIDDFFGGLFYLHTWPSRLASACVFVGFFVTPQMLDPNCLDHPPGPIHSKAMDRAPYGGLAAFVLSLILLWLL